MQTQIPCLGKHSKKENKNTTELVGVGEENALMRAHAIAWEIFLKQASKQANA